jgi:hypothetical protein
MIFSFLPYSMCYIGHFYFIQLFQVSLPYFTCLSVYFSFSFIFSFLAIFQVLQCAFLIFHVFQ